MTIAPVLTRSAKLTDDEERANLINRPLSGKKPLAPVDGLAIVC